MARYLSQLEIDVYIYISKEDREYQYHIQDANQVEERILKQFNELALSLERLHEEVGLSLREAKKVAETRAILEFKSLSEVEGIAKLAKVSQTKIKEYMNQQRYRRPELPGMATERNLNQNKTKKNTPSPKRKRKPPLEETDAESLFPMHESVSQDPIASVATSSP